MSAAPIALRIEQGPCATAFTNQNLPDIILRLHLPSQGAIRKPTAKVRARVCQLTEDVTRSLMISVGTKGAVCSYLEKTIDLRKATEGSLEFKFSKIHVASQNHQDKDVSFLRPNGSREEFYLVFTIVSLEGGDGPAAISPSSSVLMPMSMTPPRILSSRSSGRLASPAASSPRQDSSIASSPLSSSLSSSPFRSDLTTELVAAVQAHSLWVMSEPFSLFSKKLKSNSSVGSFGSSPSVSSSVPDMSVLSTSSPALAGKENFSPSSPITSALSSGIFNLSTSAPNKSASMNRLASTETRRRQAHASFEQKCFSCGYLKIPVFVFDFAERGYDLSLVETDWVLKVADGGPNSSSSPSSPIGAVEPYSIVSPYGSSQLFTPSSYSYSSSLSSAASSLASSASSSFTRPNSISFGAPQQQQQQADHFRSSASFLHAHEHHHRASSPPPSALSAAPQPPTIIPFHFGAPPSANDAVVRSSSPFMQLPPSSQQPVARFNPRKRSGNMARGAALSIHSDDENDDEDDDDDGMSHQHRMISPAPSAISMSMSLPSSSFTRPLSIQHQHFGLSMHNPPFLSSSSSSSAFHQSHVISIASRQEPQEESGSGAYSYLSSNPASASRLLLSRNASRDKLFGMSDADDMSPFSSEMPMPHSASYSSLSSLHPSNFLNGPISPAAHHYENQHDADPFSSFVNSAPGDAAEASGMFGLSGHPFNSVVDDHDDADAEDASFMKDDVSAQYLDQQQAPQAQRQSPAQELSRHSSYESFQAMPVSSPSSLQQPIPLQPRSLKQEEDQAYSSSPSGLAMSLRPAAPPSPPPTSGLSAALWQERMTDPVANFDVPSHLREIYEKHYHHWSSEEKVRKIFNNGRMMVALKRARPFRQGAEEKKGLYLAFSKTTYKHHRSMQSTFQGLDPAVKQEVLTEAQSFQHAHFSTSFGVHIAIITTDRRIVFARRSTLVAQAPSKWVCGVVEGMNESDVSVRPGDESEQPPRAYPDILKTVCRGLREEMGIALSDTEINAIRLFTLYFKAETHEWGIGGVVDLSHPSIERQNALSAEDLERMHALVEDSWENSQLHFVDLRLADVTEFICENQSDFSSSGLCVALMTLMSIFGRGAVESSVRDYGRATGLATRETFFSR